MGKNTKEETLPVAIAVHTKNDTSYNCNNKNYNDDNKKDENQKEQKIEKLRHEIQEKNDILETIYSTFVQCNGNKQTLTIINNIIKNPEFFVASNPTSPQLQLNYATAYMEKEILQKQLDVIDLTVQDVKIELDAYKKDVKIELDAYKKEVHDLNKLLDAFLFRDCTVLKEMKGFTPSQLQKFGFSHGEICEAFTSDELSKDSEYDTGHNQLNLVFDPNQGGVSSNECQIYNNGHSCKALVSSKHRCVTSEVPLPNDKLSYWKVHIEYLLNNTWIYLGLLGTRTEIKQSSYGMGTSYGWAGNPSHEVWIAGKRNNGYGNWKGFQQNDIVRMKYDPFAKSLSLKISRYGDTTFTLTCDDLNEAFLHFNLHGLGDTINLSSLPIVERDF